MMEIPHFMEDGIKYSYVGSENTGIDVFVETKNSMAIGRGKTFEEARVKGEKIMMEDESFVLDNRRLVSKWRKKHNLYELMMK